MSLVGLSSLRLNRRIFFQVNNVDRCLSKCRHRSISLSAKVFDKEEKEKEAREKLNKLLRDIKEAKSKRTETEATVTLNAKPRRKISEDQVESESKKEKKTKKVFKVKKEDPAKSNVEIEPQLDPKLVLAAHKVAGEKSRMEPNEDLKHAVRKQTESDLLKKLKSIAVETNEAMEASEVVDVNKKDISSLFSSLKIEKREVAVEKDKQSGRRSFTDEEKKFLEKRRKLRQQQSEEPIVDTFFRENKDLFTAEQPFGIFTSEFKEKPLDALPVSSLNFNSTFEECRQREIRILSRPTPRNFLEEMASWTDNGIMWHFPINNEQGIEEKDMEPFFQHVFLEPHLEPWCPPRGPVRHFMEVICVGLSKNPYITVAKKIEHINWFRDYFEKKDHKDILRLTGAIEA